MTIKKNEKGENKAFWQHAREVRAKINDWPEWKRNIRLTDYSHQREASSETCTNKQRGNEE